jgi:hypothetical protein
VRECVNRGSVVPGALARKGVAVTWEREAAVMVGGIMGQIK